MIGAKYFQKKERLYLFLGLYGMLSALGIAYSVLMAIRGQDVPSGAGFMIIFGAGMAVLTWIRGRKPLVVLHDDQLELNQTNRPEYVRYKDISSVEQRGPGQLAVKIRSGHATRMAVIYTKYLSEKDAKQLSDFLMRKGWKR